MSTSSMSPQVPKTIAVDFDGTICEFDYPRIGKPKLGVKEALTMLRGLGYRIMIYSCRTCHWHYDIFGGDPKQPTMERITVKQMIEYLDRNDIPYDLIDDGSRGKPLADFYIDDKAIRFEDNWYEIQQRISLFTLGHSEAY